MKTKLPHHVILMIGLLLTILLAGQVIGLFYDFSDLVKGIVSD